MRKRVRHYSEYDGNESLMMKEINGDIPLKTLCGFEMTPNYFYTNNVQEVTCPRCIKKLVKIGALKENDQVIRISKPSDIGHCGDERTELYLKRLGIC